MVVVDQPVGQELPRPKAPASRTLSGRGCSERTRLGEGVSQPLEGRDDGGTMLGIHAKAYGTQTQLNTHGDNGGATLTFPFHTHCGAARSHCSTAGDPHGFDLKHELSERNSLWFTSHLFIGCIEKSS